MLELQNLKSINNNQLHDQSLDIWTKCLPASIFIHQNLPQTLEIQLKYKDQPPQLIYEIVKTTTL